MYVCVCLLLLLIVPTYLYVCPIVKYYNVYNKKKLSS